APQSAEKAVRALQRSLGQEAWGHSVARLLRELPIAVDPTLVERGKVLDNAYIPSRYPNGDPEGTPFEHYGPLQSDDSRSGHGRAADDAPFGAQEPARSDGHEGGLRAGSVRGVHGDRRRPRRQFLPDAGPRRARPGDPHDRRAGRARRRARSRSERVRREGR